MNIISVSLFIAVVVLVLYSLNRYRFRALPPEKEDHKKVKDHSRIGKS